MCLQHFALFTDGWGFASAEKESEREGERGGELDGEQCGEKEILRGCCGREEGRGTVKRKAWRGRWRGEGKERVLTYPSNLIKMSERIIELTWSPCSLNMRCKYKSFGCYYESIHSSPPSGSLAIRGGKIVYCEKVDFLVSEVILFYRLFFFFLHLPPMSHPQLWIFLYSFSLFWSRVCFFFFKTLFFPPLDSFISHSLFLSHSRAFFFLFSHVSPPTYPAELCPVPCGSHGVCSEGQCQCEEGWIGAACDQRACHPRCEEHGQCHDGTCICQPGWEGEHCNIGELRVCACGSV